MHIAFGSACVLRLSVSECKIEHVLGKVEEVLQTIKDSVYGWATIASTNEVTLKSSYCWEHTNIGLDSGFLNYQNLPWPSDLRFLAKRTRYRICARYNHARIGEEVRMLAVREDFFELGASSNLGLA